MPAASVTVVELAGFSAQTFQLLPASARASYQPWYDSICERLAITTPRSTQPASQAGAQPASQAGAQPAGGRAPNRTQQITALLQKTPNGMTVNQLAKQLGGGVTAESVQTITNRQVSAGHYIKEGQRYKLIGTVVVTAPSGTAPSSSAAMPEAGTLNDRVLSYVRANPGCTKEAVITAMAPARPNHVGIALTRLGANNLITSTKTGPYSAIQALAA